MIYRVKGKRPDGTNQINVLQSAFSAGQAIRRVKQISILPNEIKEGLKWEAVEDSAPTK